MASFHSVSSDIGVDKTRLREHFKRLSKYQRPFLSLVVDWIKNPRKVFAVVSGGPGTGKSFVVRNTFDCIKTVQLRMSYTGRSAQSMGGRTIHSTLKLSRDDLSEIEKRVKGKNDLTQSIKMSRDVLDKFSCDVYPLVVIVDEVSMINGWLIYWMIRFFMDRTQLPLFFVCMGDPHQLNPIKSIHNLFSIDFSKNRYEVRDIRLTESKRYTPDYERLVDGLRDFVDREDETGMMEFIDRNFPVVDDIDADMLRKADKSMAFKNSTVKYYNEFYIKYKVDGPEIKLHDGLVLKRGCMVFVTKNNCSSVMNGTPLIFRHHLSDENQVLCEDPKTGRNVKVGIDGYTGRFPLDLGFAGTVHKYQGETIDDFKIVINLDGKRDLNLIYTALSRIRKMDQLLAIKL